MTDIYIYGALIFAAFVVFAVTITILRNKHGDPPEWHSYFVGAILVLWGFWLISDPFGGHSPYGDGAESAMVAAVTRLTFSLDFAMFATGWWILMDKNRMQRYFDRMMKKREEELVEAGGEKK